jgi:hypothetical protein
MTFSRALRCAVAACLLVLMASPAEARGTRVALIQPPSQGDELLTETRSRLKSELEAAGFEVDVIEAPENLDASAQVSSLAVDPSALAAFTIVRAGKGPDAEIWVGDRLTGKIVVRRIAVEATKGSSPTLLAIRAVELLRASLLEATVETESSRATAPAVPADVAKWMGTARTGGRRLLLQGATVEAAVAVLHGFRGIGTGFAPSLRVGYGGASGLTARINVVGPVITQDLQSAEGSAAVRQELAAAEVVYVLGRSDSTFAAIASLGLGVHHIQAQGTTVSPNVPHKVSLWSALAEVGLGGALRLSSRAAIVLDVQGFTTQPNAAVQIGQSQAGSISRPTLVASLGGLAAF